VVETLHVGSTAVQLEVEEGEDTQEEIFDFSTTERTPSQPIGDLPARFAEIVLQHGNPSQVKVMLRPRNSF
jgi:hypothetical protein